MVANISPAHSRRRRLLAFLALLATQANAAYPDKPIRFVVPDGSGGPSDTLARLIGKGLSGGLGQPVVIDIRPGASTIIGSEIVAKAPPDGYSILTGSTTHTVNPALFKKLPYAPIDDFAPVRAGSKRPLFPTREAVRRCLDC